MLEICQPELVTAQLDRILTSPPLSSSPSLCRFLRFVVEETLAGRNGSLKEYSLGVVVFDRGEEFDPRMDPIVRVQARNLRVRLGQYYSGLGAEDPVLIDLPKRTYVPVFRMRAEAPRIAAEAGGEVLADEPLAAATTSLEQAPAEAPAEAPAPPALATASAGAEPAAAQEASSGKSWPHPKWAVVGAAVVVVMLATAALWQGKPAHLSARVLHEPDPAAQDLYIRGRYLMDRQTEPALRESIDAFNRAVARDPEFAPAYAGMADAYNVMAQFGYIPPKEGMEQARRAAERALDVDPRMAEGHVSLAAIIEAYDWNWSAAEREYRKALELNPLLPAAHLWYGMFLRDQGRMQEALPELRRAAQLEPFSVFTSINLAHAYMLSGNYGAAADQARHAADLAPGMATAEVLLSNAYRAQARTIDADAALARAFETTKDNPHAISAVACAYARTGHKDQTVLLLHRLEDLSKKRYVSPFDLGAVSLTLGDEQHALDLLEEAYRQRSSGLIFLRDAKFSVLHGSPGFHSLIEKMHFIG